MKFLRTTRRVQMAVIAAGLALAVPAAVRLGAAPRPPETVSVEMVSKRFAFIPERIEAVEGDQIALAVKSADGTHGVEIKKLKLKKEVPRGGSAVLLAFTAPAPGTYEITCSEYCGRGHDDMKAVLVVKPRGL